MTERPIVDEFKGDNAELVASIKALIELSDAGGVVPHGLGGHARSLLAAASHRLAHPQPQGLTLARGEKWMVVAIASTGQDVILASQGLDDFIDGNLCGEDIGLTVPNGTGRGIFLVSDVKVYGEDDEDRDPTTPQIEGTWTKVFDYDLCVADIEVARIMAMSDAEVLASARPGEADAILSLAGEGGRARPALADFVRDRIGETFDGEAHFTAEEAQQIADALAASPKAKEGGAG